MDRIALINYLIVQRNARRYLEVTAHHHQNNFVHIHCPYKVATWPASSNDFFASNHEQFDLIFIDGIHTEEQVLTDIQEAFGHLSPNGIIVIHDCMPPDAWHQREPEAYKVGENWNGTVWKAVLRVFNECVYKCSLIDTDWGCGVIDTAQMQVPKQLQLPEKLLYELNYSWLLEYKQTVSAYLSEWVSVFYHLACMGNWQEVFKEQLLQLRQHNFRKIMLTILGTAQDVQVVDTICYELQMDIQILFSATEFTHFEKPALYAIEEYAKKNEGFVLYLHSKGVSNPADGTKIKWRRLMMRELVQNREYCLSQLPKYDVVGVNWREQYPTSHFCGNFWYASTKYLRKLADFKNYYDHPRYQIWDAVDSKRLGCEFWISSGKEQPRVLSLYCRNVDFCNANYWSNK
ncbi:MULTISPECIES: class I SAM-dependent methyltransferase [Niastella]|uniref:Class I SAM-dependent methyltransferase n=1 Tax=Niastella soli TaxID=2821487 RepID=A0ABS3Z741_9BACT|nr:class I SAM-dependent methyltransferase [Niastella soli]MBO9205510.1 class I SAM-dependent methyltransferase [Niastella soli]